MVQTPLSAWPGLGTQPHLGSNDLQVITVENAMVSIRLVKLPHQQQKFPTGADNIFGGGGGDRGEGAVGS